MNERKQSLRALNRPPQIFGSGQICLVVLELDNVYFPLWSSRPHDEHKLWTKLRVFLGAGAHPLVKCLQTFRDNWGAIRNFGKLLYGGTLLDQVE